ncbi:MAG TPA: dienelactone hydrolase family protein [Xanthobacteraceae bacterium]|nr:dienelactone hydrolase family protein [Xanthobacteraceae bacterium]
MPYGPALYTSSLALALLFVGGIAVAGGPEPVEIPDGDITLKATVYRPEGAGPFPAIVGMHDCSGLTNPSGAIASKYREWAQLLVKNGFIVIFPESYSSRGLGNQCTARNRPVHPDRERVADANAARRWLEQQPDVRADHISLLGWSNGGSSVLWTVRPQRKIDDKFDFRSAVAFYPGCRRLDSTAWAARIPTLILIGAADDVASPQDCEHMVAGAKGRSARISIMVYPGAFHDFDHPNRPPQVRTGYAFSADGSGRIHTGTDAAARADSLKRVPQWLAR